MQFEIRQLQPGDALEVDSDNWEVRGVWAMFQDKIEQKRSVEVVEEDRYRITSLVSNSGLVITFIRDEE